MQYPPVIKLLNGNNKRNIIGFITVYNDELENILKNNKDVKLVIVNEKDNKVKEIGVIKNG